MLAPNNQLVLPQVRCLAHAPGIRVQKRRSLRSKADMPVPQQVINAAINIMIWAGAA